MVSQHIPSSSLTLWGQTIPRNEIPTYKQLLTFLENRFRKVEFSPIVQTHIHPQSQKRFNSTPQTFHIVPAACRCCNGDKHPIRTCPTFLKMVPTLRMDMVHHKGKTLQKLFCI